MYTSDSLTVKVNNTANPEEAEFKIWQNARYLVAHEASSPDFTETTEEFYKGRHVIPAPKADGTLTAKLLDEDFNIIKHQFAIRFTNSLTTDSADSTIGRALYGIMETREADEYEEYLRNERKRVHSKTAK